MAQISPQLSIGDRVPDMSFESTDPELKSFKHVLGKNVVLYFYPRDHTPGCTLEGRDFKEIYPELLKLNTVVIGVSRDPLSSHQRFCAKLGLPFPLISDPDEKLCRAFNVMIENNVVLRFLLGVERSTFLIDQQGKIRQIWRKVKAKNHAQAVLEAVQRYSV